MTKKHFIFSLLLLLALTGTSRAAEGVNCYETFYQSKDMGCLDLVIKESPKAGTKTFKPAFAGFFAEVFSTYPREKSRLLNQDIPLSTKALFVVALCEASLQDEAETYANVNGLAASFRNTKCAAFAPLNQVRPLADPKVNDVLIGAFMASGKTEYIKRILENFSDADDRTVSDALRIGMLQGKFGPTLVPRGREATTIKVACEKYECKKDIRNLMRVMTLASAFWAIQSLSRQDAVIKKTFGDFFDGDPRLKQLLFIEGNAFANYLVVAVAFAAIKDNSNIEASLSIYEKLGPAKDAVEALAKAKKN